MVFSSIIFLWIFLPIVFLGNVLLIRIGGVKASNLLLLLASLFFYAWGEPVYVILMIVSILMNWVFGLLLEHFRQRKRARAFTLAVGVIANLSMLGYFKYASMFVGTLNRIAGHEVLKDPKIPLPIGISFFTFQAMSYVIDVYRGECETQRSLPKLALYVSFFPQLIAGPIVKYKDVNKQIDNRQISLAKASFGFRRFIYGLAKKVLISNILGDVVDRIIGTDISQISCLMGWVAMGLYLMQLYYDFSGYSDMAIGLGKMFGFDFHENFRYPLISCSFQEFWVRWHLSLSTWFREYVYFSLGGSRKGKVRTYINLMAIFLLTGFWHGAGYNFIIWGFCHGVCTIAEHMGFKKILDKNKVIGWFYTMFMIVLTVSLFRLDNTILALQYMHRMLMPWKYASSAISLWEFIDHHALFAIVTGFIGMGFLQKAAGRFKWMNRWKYSVPEAAYCAVILGLSILSVASSTYNPFIYFKF